MLPFSLDVCLVPVSKRFSYNKRQVFSTIFIQQHLSHHTISANIIFTILCEPCHEKTCLREFPTRSDSNWPAQLQKLEISAI